jgi:DNA polymerase-1
MKTLTFVDKPKYPLVILTPPASLNDIEREYLTPFKIPRGDVQVGHLFLQKKKTPVTVMREFLEIEVVSKLKDVKYVIVTDAGYYKVITGQDSAEANIGYVQNSKYGSYKVLYAPSIRSILYDPTAVRAKISRSMNALLADLKNTYKAPGTGIIHFEAYPQTDDEIAAWLEKLLEMDCLLSIDSETFSLHHTKSGIGTLTFCWSKHEGIAFPVDYVAEQWVDGEGVLHYGKCVRNQKRRDLLVSFFRRLRQKTLYHNISFDATILIAQLFMKHILDTEGLLEGLDIVLRDWECTQLITYLATNTCAGNDLGLKYNAQEFAGNYAVDELEDITLTPLADLLRYNLVDGLSTWYVYEKNWPILLRDNQLDIYLNLFKPSVIDIVQAQLTGLPLDMAQVKRVKEVLEAIEKDALKRLETSDAVQEFTYELRSWHVIKRNAELKVKRIIMDDAETQAIFFNPRSSQQLQRLLYEMLEFPVIATTKSKNPSTDGETLELLLNHTKSDKTKAFLQALIDYKGVVKILEFLGVFENMSAQGPDGWWYLFGFFKLGGTQSGRLSSNNPNLQNLPANVEMALQAIFLSLYPWLKKFVKKGMLHLGKLIKSCIKAPKGWLWSGLDFMSLEDRISALTTKDPNKLKVYTDGYDGHSLRAYAYYGDEMPDIDPNSVASINSIQDKYKTQRQDSKAPTFALTYLGTWKTLITNCGFSEEKAKKIEARYHEMYKVSDKWVADQLAQAGKDGYITAAFGLRIRTPLLAQVIRGTKGTPHEAEAEGRSAGNALGQSWCMLTNRAAQAFMKKVRKSKYRLQIKIAAFIHDALYFIVADNAEVVLWVNEHLREEVRWQDHPAIAHDEVKLDGVFTLFWPNWANEIDLPYKATFEQMNNVIKEKLGKAA